MSNRLLRDGLTEYVAKQYPLIYSRIETRLRALPDDDIACKKQATAIFRDEIFNCVPGPESMNLRCRLDEHDNLEYWFTILQRFVLPTINEHLMG